jgi:hypothetical protein
MGVYLCMQNEQNNTTREQQNTYQVIYSDGITVLDYITASNLKDACQIAKQNKYATAYYKVKRCYNGGVRG